jgi:hypothetical protein
VRLPDDKAMRDGTSNLDRLTCTVRAKKRMLSCTGMPHFIALRRYCFFFFFFFTNLMFVATLRRASLSAPFFQQHVITSCLCHILAILAIFQTYYYIEISKYYCSLTMDLVTQELWWRCTKRLMFRITGVSDFIHRPDFNNYKKKGQTRRFGNWMFPSSDEGRHLFCWVP